MIIDRLENLHLYFSLNQYLELAAEFVNQSKPEVGRYELSQVEGQCYAMVSQSKLKSQGEARLEVHNRYIDLQVVLAGVERFGISPRCECTKPVGEMDDQKDILFFEDQPHNYVDLKAGQFAIFMPQDAHSPLIGSGEVNKVVVKLALQ